MTKPIEPLPESSSRGPRGVPSANPAKFRQIEEILKIGEAELDQQRKRSFARPPEEEGELEHEETRAPSPFETSFHRQPTARETPSAPVGFRDLEPEVIPMPETSPPPQLNMAHRQFPVEEHELPEAKDFWEEFNLPDQPPEPVRLNEEAVHSYRKEAPRSERPWARQAEEPPEKKEEAPISRPAGKTIKKAQIGAAPKKEEIESLETFGKKAKLKGTPGIKKTEPEETETPGKIKAEMKKEIPGGKKTRIEEEVPSAQQGIFQKKEKIGPNPALPQSVQAKKGIEKPPQPFSEEQLEEIQAAPSKEELTPRATEPKKKGESITPPIPKIRREKETRKPEKEPRLWEETEIPSTAQRSEEEEHGKKKPSAEPVAVQPPDPLPPNCQRVAEIVQTASTPFLNSQTAALYYQMVGTIVYMASAQTGISVTEVMLNTPAFQNSVFFNTTIRIERYATAPDSFNIRLTGTPEAVKVFNSNVENLTNAFTAAYEDRRVSFRVGRLETSLAPERHIIRRKKESGGKEDRGTNEE